MQTEVVTREQVIELAKQMPAEKLVRWYEYGLYIQSHPLAVPDYEPIELDDEALLMEEFAAWEAASDEDWIKFENNLEKVN
jgi:hypothetical protein